MLAAMANLVYKALAFRQPAGVEWRQSVRSRTTRIGDTDMASTVEVRRQNLRRLVSEHEGMNNLARKLGLTKGAYISQLLTDPDNPHHRVFSEKTARKWEKKLGLPEGWLDGPPRSPANGIAAPLNGALLAQVIAEVNTVLASAGVKLTPVQTADLVVMQYKDALPCGRIDPERIRAIVGLLRR